MKSNVKMKSHQHRNYHCKNKKALWPSYLYMKISVLEKTVFVLIWGSPVLVLSLPALCYNRKALYAENLHLLLCFRHTMMTSSVKRWKTCLGIIWRIMVPYSKTTLAWPENPWLLKPPAPWMAALPSTGSTKPRHTKTQNLLSTV